MGRSIQAVDDAIVPRRNDNANNMDYRSILLLLPVLVLSGACTQTVPSAIATDDRPSSPQPAIASPIAAPLTIESLAGTYRLVDDEQEIANEQREMKKQGMNVPLELLRTLQRQANDYMKITINVDGTFESPLAIENQRGKVRIDGKKLILTDVPSKPVTGSVRSTKAPKCSECCELTLNVSSDGKKLLLYDPKNLSKIIRVYVKQ